MRRVISAQGYVQWIALEHRIIAEAKLGRPLRTGEVVHHRNGDRQDNRPSNLRVFRSRSAHMAHHRRRRSLRFVDRHARYVATVTGRSFSEVLEASAVTAAVGGGEPKVSATALTAGPRVPEAVPPHEPPSPPLTTVTGTVHLSLDCFCTPPKRLTTSADRQSDRCDDCGVEILTGELATGPRLYLAKDNEQT